MPRINEIEACLRARIEAGNYPPGTTIPKEVELADEFDVDRSTVRRVIARLRASGLVTPRKRRGTVVRLRVRVTLAIGRYAQVMPGKGPWETVCAQQGLTGHTVVLGVSERVADEAVTTALGIPAGSKVIHRANHMYIDKCVAQIQETFLPMQVAAQTPLAAPGKCTGGIYLALSDAGHPPSVADETVTSRMPTPDEAETLSLDQGSPVMVIERTTRDIGGRAIVHTRIVIDGDRVTLAYHQML